MNVRIMHRLPGRLRLDIPDMVYQQIVAYQLQTYLETIDGIQEAACNSFTGRALIRFDERVLSAPQIMELLMQWLPNKIGTQRAEVAAAREEAVSAAQRPSLRVIPGNEPDSPFQAFAVRDNPYFLPAVVSGSLLGLLTVKRFLIGRSALAAAPIPFYAAAGLSIAAGYPAIRRGVEGLIKERKASPDLWIGLATLSLAALRENLVALSAITLLNLALYRRHTKLDPMEATHLDPETERYSRRMSRVGFWLTPLTFLLTRSPLHALGVLLAANPRPAMLAHKYTWAQAEEEAAAKGIRVPGKGNLETLAAVRTIVLTDEQVLNEDGHEWDIRVLREGVEAGKILATAASLLQKEEHPWRDALLEAAQQDNRTLRTPFHVEVSADGVRGTLNGHETVFGSKNYVKQTGLDLTPVLLEERRMRREGFKPYLLVQDGDILALIGRKQQLAPEWHQQIDRWQQQGFSVVYLQRGERIPSPLPMKTLDELRKDLEHQQPVLVIGGLNEIAADNPHVVMIKDTGQLDETIRFCREVQNRIRNDLRIVKTWNAGGIGLAFLTPIAAPLINLLGDAVGVMLLARNNWQHRLQDGEEKAMVGKMGRPGTAQGPFFAMNTDAVLQQFHSRVQGLNAQEVLEKRKQFGLNVLQAAPPPNPLQVFLGHFKDLSALILLGASGLSFVMGEPFNALIMGGILVVNAMIGTWQELRSGNVLQALKNEDHSRARVLRDGKEQKVLMQDLVPGDIVLFEAGEMVPADIRILEANNMEVNEAMLTGESLPVAKLATAMELETQMSDRNNMLYMGTLVTRGTGKGIVVATGDATEIGAIQSLLQTEEEPPTPLQIRVSEISKRFLIGAFAAGGVVIAAGLLRGIPPLELLLSSVTMAASAIPEGLPLTITIALTAGVMRMAKQKTVVRKLSSLESLGRVTVICSDKTGTLTRNEMTVKEMTTVNRHIAVGGEGYVAVDQDMQQLLTIGLLCNNASLERNGEEFKAMGDPTEIALLAAGRKAELDVSHWIRHHEIPFDSYTGSMSVVCQEGETSENCHIFTKGSTEAVLKKCTYYQQNGQIYPLTDEIREQIEAENMQMAKKALRVLAMGYRELADGETPKEALDEGLIFVGMMGMIDPPKEEVAASIEEVCRLGVKPVMITGDHPVTASAIGEQLGIYRQGDRVLTGEDLERLSAAELAALVKDTTVFARVTPEHKLRIVEAFQSNGEVVAMTGDGVNDAPAIRKADVGIAMGAKGTEVTKDTAGIVLLEDGFHSIVEGIKEGRTIIGNIRKAIGCLLTGNLAEVLVGAAAVVVGLPMPLIPLQILLMNLLTDALPAMVLATDPQRTGSESTYKDVADRSMYRTVVTRGTILGLGSLTVFAGALMTGAALPVAQTMAFATLVAGQLIQTVAWRRHEAVRKVSLREDRPLFLAMGVSWFALLMAMYLPSLQGIFATVPLGITQWAAVLAAAGSVTTLSSLLLQRRQPDVKQPIQAIATAA